MHNCRRYDTHLVMQQIGAVANEYNLDVDCIPKSTENYVMFSLKMPPINQYIKHWKIIFMDSFQFLPSSLDSLTNNLLNSGSIKFQLMNYHFEAKVLDLLLRKGIYQYEYMDNWAKFDEQQLPPKEGFKY